ncbi:efflux RND transporter periplasmic adaptor subunit [Ekhidna sp. To15]|uniref:efflux RND transporter periplasmic adaptor subunit n=1 Tax=Ekhidna sp. To15 TaxID=3395267 RepID=UPI003F526DAB
MRKINHILTLFVAFAIVACGENESTISSILAEGDMENIRAKKKELSAQHKELEGQMALLDSAIAANTENSNLPLVTTFQTSIAEFYHFVELQGDVTTKQNLLIYPEAAGTLVRVHVEEGQRVQKGQLLGTIDDGGLESQLIQMKTQLDLAKTTFERQQRLWDQKIGSEIQYLQAKTNYESQKNAVDQMKKQLEKFYIRAPFSGVIDDVIKDQGTVVSPGPGAEIFRIVNLSNMYIEVLVPETFIASVVPGKDVKVFFPIINKTLEAKVKETGNYINPNNRSFNVRIPVPNQNGMIKPNLTAKVHINDYYSEAAILIPQSVISENAEGEQYVYVVRDVKGDKTATAQRAIITTGKTQDGKVEILSGIGSEENIILEGARSVKDGQQVKILND